MFITNLIKKLIEVKNKIDSAQTENVPVKVIAVTDKIDVFYDDVYKKINYEFQLNSVKNINKNLNTLEIERTFTNSTATKLEYYENLLLKTNDQQINDQMLNKISDLKSQIGNIINNFTDKSKSDALKKIITENLKENQITQTITGFDAIRSNSNPVIQINDLKLVDLNLNVKILSHPAPEWSNWKLDINPYFYIKECIWLNKGRNQSLRFGLTNDTPGLILTSLYDSYEICVSIGTIPPNIKLTLTTQSTDEIPFKKFLNTSTGISSISVDEIITED